MEFDKKVLLQNIEYLLKKKRMKKGDLEKKIGVSPGYISRINKKNNGVAAGVDIIKKIADALEVSVDVLISIDMERVDDNSLYAINFMKALEIKTEAKEVFWRKIDVHTITEIMSGEMDPSADLAMIKVAPGQHIPDYDYDPRYTIQKVYKSYFIEPFLVQGGEFPYNAMPWFELNLDDENTAILTCMYLYINDNDYEKILELYIDTAIYHEEYDDEGRSYAAYDHSCTPLCCSETMGDDVFNAIESLYNKVYAHQHDIRINDGVKNALDNFMKK